MHIDVPSTHTFKSLELAQLIQAEQWATAIQEDPENLSEREAPV